jgi:sugar phosphate isomerase/epimerase
LKFAICNELFEGWEFERVCRFVKSIGYDGVELAPFTLANPITALGSDRRATLRRQAADHGVEIIGLHWLLAKTQGFHLTSPDADVRNRTAAYLMALAEACRDFGGTLMVFGSPLQRSLPPGVSQDQAYGWAADTLRGVTDTLDRSGVRICMEPLSPDETNFVTTCADAVRLIEMVDHPRVTLHLDVKAMASEPSPMLDLIRRYGPRAGHFHANDPTRRGPGFGEVDFVPIFDALRQSGYNRWISVEVFDYSPDPETIARRSIEYMKECLR